MRPANARAHSRSCIVTPAGLMSGPPTSPRDRPRLAAAASRRGSGDHRTWRHSTVRLLLARLSWRSAAELDELAPTHVEVPSGSRIRIDYADPQCQCSRAAPGVIGSNATPSVAGGSVPPTFICCRRASTGAGHTRPRRFLAQFVLRSLQELRGRYPKMAWPDHPARCWSRLPPCSATCTRERRYGTGRYLLAIAPPPL